MDKYKVRKVLNNNVVIAEKDKKEFVLVGKAIGYNTNKGSVIFEDRVENIFVKKSQASTENFNKVLESVDSEIVGISEEIISLCEMELKIKLSEAVHVSLPDHINFAIRRVKQGVKIENPFLHELMALYPAEYRLAQKALDMIIKRFNIDLPEDEIGFICMHIKAAVNQQEVTSALAYTKKIGEVMELISKLLKKNFDKNSLEYIRTVTHINFMIERIMKKKTIKNYLLDSIKKDLYNEYDVAIKVAMKIENLFSIKVPEDEIGYITLHLSRISET
ncbi:PRD domain protein [Clostridiales bacterium oral taxon 876 str. F0540]|nr:PRD domain protein [Clostridiales bacterium oral taxon 876 str. F0540]